MDLMWLLATYIFVLGVMFLLCLRISFVYLALKLVGSWVPLCLLKSVTLAQNAFFFFFFKNFFFFVFWFLCVFWILSLLPKMLFFFFFFTKCFWSCYLIVFLVFWPWHCFVLFFFFQETPLPANIYLASHLLVLCLSYCPSAVYSWAPIRSDQIRSVTQSCPTLQPHELQHSNTHKISQRI